MTQRPIVHVADSVLGYYGRPVLTVSSFRASAGEVVAVLGENGSGKSTLLLALSGALKPIRGRIARNVGRHEVGYLPQFAEIGSLLPMTVAEYVSLGLAGRRASASKLMSALSAADIEDLADAQATTLSGGQRRRMMLARALVRSPRLLLIDEPEAGIDAATRAFVLSQLKELAQRGACVVMATHDQAWAGLAERRYLLADGMVCGESA
ncbi:MAG: ATP-binding cassette domain-containing protein [Planctomycetota bacterium]